MVVILMAVGAVMTVVGLAAVAYGIPYNDFGLGNILVVSGTTATVAGVILIALSAILRELLALRAALEAGAAERMMERPPERPAAPVSPRGLAAEPPPEPPSALVAAERLRAAPPDRLDAPMLSQPTLSQPMPPQPLPPQPPLRAPQTPPPLRRADLEGGPPEPPPASYRPPMVAPPPAPGPASDIGLPDGLRGRPAASRGLAGERGAERGPPDAVPSPPPDWVRDPLGEAPSAERSKRFFGWTRRRQTISPDAEAPLSEMPPPGFERSEPAEPPAAAPRAPARPVPPPPRAGGRAAPPASPAAPAPAPTAPSGAGAEEPAVLKSGVIDGMGYTLYTDGSIDAAFGNDTLRFASIEDLRRHLEQNAG